MATKKVNDRKTQPTAVDVDSFLDAVEDERRREDAKAVTKIMREITKVEPIMWGPAMVGFGDMPYTAADGKERDYFAIGLSPRKTALTLYGLTFYGSNQELLDRLGKITLGKGCVYIKRLSDVDLDVLRELVAHAWSTNHKD